MVKPSFNQKESQVLSKLASKSICCALSTTEQYGHIQQVKLHQQYRKLFCTYFFILFVLSFTSRVNPLLAHISHASLYDYSLLMHQFFIYKFTKKYTIYYSSIHIESMKQQSSKACNPCHATSSSLHYFLLFLVAFFPIHRWVQSMHIIQKIYTSYPHSLTHPPSSSATTTTVKIYPFITWRLSSSTLKSNQACFIFQEKQPMSLWTAVLFLVSLKLFFCFLVKWCTYVVHLYVHTFSLVWVDKCIFTLLLLFIATIYFYRRMMIMKAYKVHGI